MNLIVILASLLMLTSVGAEELSKSNLRAQGCQDLERMVCKSESTKRCEAVYVAKPDATADCRNKSLANIKNVCGSETAVLFITDKECIGAAQDESCPDSIKKISKSSVTKIYKCESLHQELCKSVCGPSYGSADVRNFSQTGGKPGVVCLDGAAAPRSDCNEVHQGNSKWCISYNKVINKVEFGMFFQCAGKF